MIKLNYGNDPADQIVRFSLEGTEMALKLSGLAAKNFALFVCAVLKDQKKTRGKTRLVRMLKEQRPFKFFKIPAWQMKEFAREAKGHGLLYVPIRNKRDNRFIEIVSFADEASKIQRIYDNLGLDYVASQAGEATVEKVLGQEKTASENQQENPENFTAGRAGKLESPAAEKNPSEISSPSKSSCQGSVSREQKSSVKKELQEIRQEQAKKKAEKSKQQERQISGRSRKKKKKAKSRS